MEFGFCCQIFWAISSSVINILRCNCLQWACHELLSGNSVENYLFQQTNWDWLDPISREWVLLINRLLYMNLSTHNAMLGSHWLIYVLIWQPWFTEIFCFGLLIKYFLSGGLEILSESFRYIKDTVGQQWPHMPSPPTKMADTPNGENKQSCLLWVDQVKSYFEGSLI